MCGIVGYIGDKKAQPILLNSLGKLEYRGYDSCGIAIADGGIEIYKDVVRVKTLTEMLTSHTGKTGIGHTRWATHGEPSKVNAHPHADCKGKIAVVHNGTINNFMKLREKLAAEGHTLASETDTEVIPHLIEKYYDGDFEKAVMLAVRELEGAYTMIAMMAGEHKIIAARKESPLIVGIGDRENFIASDVPALLDYTSRVIYLEDDDIVIVTASDVKIKQNGNAIKREEHKISWSMEDAQKGGYEHFMLKEIHEQPKVIRDTLTEYLSNPEPAVELAGIKGSSLENIIILGCGTSYHAGMVGKYVIEGLLDVPVRVEFADEFNYSGQSSPRNQAIVITQSGETRDVLKAIQRLKRKGSRVIAITNVVGSSVTRVADKTVYINAGPEISVASTKAFIAELISLYWLALPYAKVDAARLDELVLGLRQLPVKVQQVLDNEDEIAAFAKKMAVFDNVFYIGKGINYPVALEGALKIKEISYIHAEGYAAGELKHGPFALLGDKTPVVAVVTQDETYEPTVTSIKEIKARHSPVIALVGEDDDVTKDLADYVFKVPKVDPLFSPVVNSVALQLLAYFVAKERSCPIDFPRNLAKSVTVE
jgi:glucosamine--fructose-6-phosphate aminotransferase (isomerizing)